MERYLPHLIRGAEQRTRDFLAMQVCDPLSPQNGGIRGDILDVKPTVYALTTAMACYLHPQSALYRQETLLRAMERAVQFVIRNQRENGSFDYPSCNFYSAPDTSFCFKRMISAYRLMTGCGKDCAELSPLREAYRGLLHRALCGIRDGGFHTPNHRWAITAALMQGANLFAQEAEFAESLRARAGQYLAEGIDGDEDGEYAERSSGNYNAVVNNSMLALWQETGDETYLGYVRRNLAMMLTYIDPDGLMFTQNSTRQDLGRRDRPDRYFYQYLAVCSHEKNAEFDAAAHKIIADNLARGDLAPDCLHILMNHPELAAHRFTGCAYLSSYRKYYPHSRVLRVCRPDFTYTVMGGKSDFLYVKRGELMLCVKLGESYCAIRNFIPSGVETLEDGCRLTGTAEGWYYQPFREPPETFDWWEMDHSKREKLISSTLSTEVTIREEADGLAVSVHTEGLDRLPLRLEVCLPAGVTLSHEAFRMQAGAGGELILREGWLEARGGADAFAIGPGFGEHEFHGHYSGEEKNAAGFTVYCNAYTPVEKTIHIRAL